MRVGRRMQVCVCVFVDVCLCVCVCCVFACLYECMCAQLDGEAVLSAEFVQRDDLADERMEIELSDSLLEEREGPA